MKKWNNPELKNLNVQNTNQDDECLFEDEVATYTLLPVIVWGDGKLGCTYWDCTKKGCTNPNYGKKGKFWPCPQAKPSHS